MSLALLRRNPQLQSLIIDIENVCAAGRGIVAEHPEGERISYQAADFVNDDLPGGFELVLECDINIYGDELMVKLHAALKPGGRLVIVDYFSPAPGRAHPSRLHWAFVNALRDPDHAPVTADEVRSQLARAGFQIATERSLSGDSLMIEARR
jgi:hypothetical protein